MQSMKKYLKIGMLFFVMGVILFTFCKESNFLKNFNEKTISSYIVNSGRYAVLCFLMIYALKPLLFILPSALLALVGGTLFGPLRAFILNMIGFFLSGSLAFFLSRALGQSFVTKLLQKKSISLGETLNKNGFKILFFLRLPPILPFDPLSYAAGLTKISYGHFIFASLLGVIPETLCYSYMGKNLLHPTSHKFMIPFILMLSFVVVSSYFFRKEKDKEDASSKMDLPS